MAGPDQIGPERIAAGRATVAESCALTPTLHLGAIDELIGGATALKAESLQHTGSFKVRGAIAKLDALGERGADGVTAGTAGNHGRALAWAARRRGVRCELFVPADAPIAKTEPAARLGAAVERCPGAVEDCVALARSRAEAGGLAFVHPFDDPDVIAGQGTIGLELLEQVPDLARVIVPLGGGGLASGIAIAVKSERPAVDVVGVQAEACAAFPPSLEQGEPVAVPASVTVADGIAVKRPGEITLPLIERWLDDVVVVTEDEVGDAMAELLAEAKLVVEGAGAVGLAALLAGRTRPASDGVTAVVLSGGNVDETMLAAISRRSGARHGRGAVLFTTIADRPGSLARLLEAVGSTGASVVDVQHVRDAVDLHVAESGVELILETRDRAHTAEIVDALRGRGYAVKRQHTVSERSGE
ncbi:MAG: threonine ammonia-lyase [Solirubrobacterales bacterium]